MDKIKFVNNSEPALNAENLEKLQNNIEKSAVVVSPTQPTTNEKVWFKKGKNLFNKNNFVSIESYIDGSNGEIKPYTGYTKMLILPINGGNSYTISRTAGKHFRAGTTSSYPANGVTVSNFKVNNTGTSITVTAGANDKYLVCSYYQKGVDTITATVIESSLQIEPGLKASAYEAYIEPTIFVKNGSIFEEFIRISDIPHSIKEYNYTFDCGLILHFIKYGKIVTCLAEGVISNLANDVNQIVNISSDLTPRLQVRQAFVLDETGIIAYINLPTSRTLEFRVKTAITSNRFPRFSFTYIAKN